MLRKLVGSRKRLVLAEADDELVGPTAIDELDGRLDEDARVGARRVAERVGSAEAPHHILDRLVVHFVEPDFEALGRLHCGEEGLRGRLVHLDVVAAKRVRDDDRVGLALRGGGQRGHGRRGRVDKRVRVEEVGQEVLALPEPEAQTIDVCGVVRASRVGGIESLSHDYLLMSCGVKLLKSPEEE